MYSSLEEVVSIPAPAPNMKAISLACDEAPLVKDARFDSPVLFDNVLLMADEGS